MHKTLLGFIIGFAFATGTVQAEEYVVLADPKQGTVLGAILQDGQDITDDLLDRCGNDCEYITDLVPNQCVAIAFGAGGAWGWERGAAGVFDEELLRAKALGRCRENTSFGCRDAGFVCNR